jgi:glycosyltransferase involved in cell wall biosynthesis
MPKLSVITVCFNAEKTIERTIQSVQAQTFSSIEHIIVDGASKDNTLAIIEKCQNANTKFISEKDNGLYDGMNKGIDLATGDYLYFLNADDVFYANAIVEKIFASKENADVYYGEVMFIDEEGNEMGLRSKVTTQQTPEKLDCKALQKGMVVSHQAFFVRKINCVKYDLQYKVSSDIDWMINCLKRTVDVVNTKLVFAKFATGGTSKQLQKLAWKERFFILQKHYGFFTNLYNHFVIIVRRLFSKSKY